MCDAPQRICAVFQLQLCRHSVDTCRSQQWPLYVERGRPEADGCRPIIQSASRRETRTSCHPNVPCPPALIGSYELIGVVSILVDR